MRRRFLRFPPLGAAALGGAFLFASATAHADPKAEALVTQGMQLSEQGKYTEACPKYAEAIKIDPSLNTQINLAECYDHLGKSASAYTLWVSIEQLAKAASRPKDVAKAHDRVTALEPSVPRLKITLPTDSGKDAVVKVDGAKIANDAIDKVLVDPGEHAVDVTAPGKKAWHDDVSVQLGTLLVEVPPFTTPGSEPPPPEHVAAVRPSPAFRIAGAVIAGLGVIGLGIGVVSGTTAIGHRNDAQESCGDNDPRKCHSLEGVQLWKDAKDAGSLSTIGFVAGGALVAVGAVVFLIAPNRPLVSAAIDPTTHSARLGVSGSF